MVKQFSFNLKADFSELLGGRKIVSARIGPDGDANLLAVTPESEKAPFGRDEHPGFASFPHSVAKDTYSAVYIRHDGQEVVQRTELRELAISHPFVQPLPGSEILLVGSRCRFRNGDPEKNAVIFNSDGELVRQFVLGDGINDVQTTREGMIWTSYFDEGVFGNFGWATPLGSSGLVCFDSAGRKTWEFSSSNPALFIADCYALNVTEKNVWACYYTDFPLVRIGSGKTLTSWESGISGATALAVNGPQVLFWGGYGDESSRCVIKKIDGEKLIGFDKVRLCLPNGEVMKKTDVIGRGNILHAFVNKSWFAYELSATRPGV